MHISAPAPSPLRAQTRACRGALPQRRRATRVTPSPRPLLACPLLACALLVCALLACAESTLPDQDISDQPYPAQGGSSGGGGLHTDPSAGVMIGGVSGATQPPLALTDLKLTVTSPARGAYLTGAQTRLEGEVSGAMTPTLTVNGQETPVGPDGRFSATVPLTPGLNTFVTALSDGEARREDRRAALVDATADPATSLSDALSFQISRAGFDEISGAITRAVSNLNIASIAGLLSQQGVTIHTLQHGPLAIAIYPEAECVNLILRTVGPSYINGLAPGDDCLTVAGGVNSIGIALSGQFEGISISGSVFLYGANLLIFLVPQVSGDGGVSMRLVNPLVTIHGDPVISVDGLPDFLFELFSDLIKDLMEKALRDALSNVALPALFDPSALTQRLDLLGHPVDLALKLTALDLTHEAMRVNASARISAVNPTHLGGALPPQVGVPMMTTARDLDVALAGDFIGRLAHAAWAAGALDLSVNDLAGDTPIPLTVALLATALGEAAMGVDRAAPLLMNIRALLPPVVSVGQGERPLKVDIGDLLLDLATAAEGVLATLALHLQMEVGLKIAPNAMSGALELVPDIGVTASADVAETPRGAVNEAALEQLIGAFMGAIPALAATPIPLDPNAPAMGMGLGMSSMTALPITLLAGELLGDLGAPFLHFVGDLGAP